MLKPSIPSAEQQIYSVGHKYSRLACTEHSSASCTAAAMCSCTTKERESHLAEECGADEMSSTSPALNRLKRRKGVLGSVFILKFDDAEQPAQQNCTDPSDLLIFRVNKQQLCSADASQIQSEALQHSTVMQSERDAYRAVTIGSTTVVDMQDPA